MLNGCVLLKPRTGAFAAFPDVFQEEDVVEVSVDWRDLDKHVESLLKVIPSVQGCLGSTMIAIHMCFYSII